MAVQTLLAFGMMAITAVFLTCACFNMGKSLNHIGSDDLYSDQYLQAHPNATVSKLVSKTKAIHSVYLKASILLSAYLVYGFVTNRKDEDALFLIWFSFGTYLIFQSRLIMVLASNRVDGCEVGVDCAYKITGDYFLHHAVSEYIGLAFYGFSSSASFWLMPTIHAIDDD